MKVDAVSTKEVNTKRGKATTYSFKGDDGQWYSCGFDNPGVSKGDEVDFDFDNTAYGNKVKFETLKITPVGAKESISVAKKPAFQPRGGGGGFSRPEKVFPIPPLHGDRSIVRQNALTNAREMVMAMEGCSSSKIVNNAETQDAFAKAIIRVARQFEAYSAGDIERLGVEEKK